MDMRMLGWLFTVASAWGLVSTMWLTHMSRYPQLPAWMAYMFGESLAAYMVWWGIFLVLGIGLIKKIRIAEVIFTCALLIRGILAVIAVGPNTYALAWFAGAVSCGVMIGRQYRLDRHSSDCQ